MTARKVLVTELDRKVNTSPVGHQQPLLLTNMGNHNKFVIPKYKANTSISGIKSLKRKSLVGDGPPAEGAPQIGRLRA
jgi:hypothetical protein